MQKRVVAFARLSKEWLCGNWSWSSHSRSNQKPPLCSWHRGLHRRIIGRVSFKRLALRFA